jgi:hypothetical protein
MSEFTVDYFIAKFEAIPEEEWCVEHYSYSGAHCAMGHCGAREGEKFPDEAMALSTIFMNAGMSVANINDIGFSRDARYTEITPKQRILAALRDIKAAQDA